MNCDMYVRVESQPLGFTYIRMMYDETIDIGIKGTSYVNAPNLPLPKKL